MLNSKEIRISISSPCGDCEGKGWRNYVYNRCGVCGGSGSCGSQSISISELKKLLEELDKSKKKNADKTSK